MRIGGTARATLGREPGSAERVREVTIAGLAAAPRKATVLSKKGGRSRTRPKKGHMRDESARVIEYQITAIRHRDLTAVLA
jgi:hypothetical protein